MGRMDDCCRKVYQYLLFICYLTPSQTNKYDKRLQKYLSLRFFFVLFFLLQLIEMCCVSNKPIASNSGLEIVKLCGNNSSQSLLSIFHISIFMRLNCCNRTKKSAHKLTWIDLNSFKPLMNSDLNNSIELFANRKRPLFNKCFNTK